MMRHIALILCVLTGASRAAQTPADRVAELFDAMRVDDRQALRSIYSERAWLLLHPSGGDEGVGDVALMLQQRMATVRAVEVMATTESGDTSIVTVKIIQQPANETAHLFFRKQAGAWRIDYARDDAEAPFCLDEMACAFLVWDVAYRQNENVKDPVLWYRNVLHGVRRAVAMSECRPQSPAVLYNVGSLYWDQLSLSRHSALSKDAIRREVHDPRKFKHLAAYDFPYGMPPHAIAFDYFKRAQLLTSAGGEHPQLSSLIVDCRPGLALKSWAEHEFARARQREADAAKDKAALTEAIFSYDRAAKLCADAEAEYTRHIAAYPLNKTTYAGHLQDLAAFAPAASADAAWLRAQSLVGVDRAGALGTAKENYRKARDAFKAVMMIYDDPEDQRDYLRHVNHVEARLREL